MALSPTVLTPIFFTSLIGSGLIGPGTLQLAEGLASGLSNYCTSGVKVQSIDTGTLGVGSGVGVGVIMPLPTILVAMQGTFIAHGLIGPFAPLKAQGISQAIVQSLLLAQISTTSPSVGVGAGVATFIPNPAFSLSSFKDGLEGAGMKGSKVPDLAAAVSEAIDIAFPMSIGIIAIAGSPSIVPSAGSGSGSLS